MKLTRSGISRNQRVLVRVRQTAFAAALIAAMSGSLRAQFPEDSSLSREFTQPSVSALSKESTDLLAFDCDHGPALVLAERAEFPTVAKGSPAPLVKGRQLSKLPDFNRNIFYKNKIEFGLDVGWLPINIPFPFDFLLGDSYTDTGLNYTLVPVIASLRWHPGDIHGPVVLRGDWDVTFSLSATAIPRGPETHYFAYIMGLRRNFVPRRWRATPYVDARAGLGDIDAKGPLGVRFAQGQNFTFTLNMGSGFRYNLSPRYAISVGLNWMHISNLYLSQPKFLNYGINVWGPMVGIDVRLGHKKPTQ